MYRTLRMTDGTLVTLRLLRSGPGGVISAPGQAPRLYLWHAKHGTYWLVPQTFTADDMAALDARINGR